MSFSAFRNPLRASVRRAAQPSRLQLRSSFNRKFSTPPPPPPAAEAKSSNTTLYLGLGGVVIGAVGYYIYSSNDASNAVKSGVQSAKVKVNFVPTKEDYIKVRGVVVFRDVYRLISVICRSTTGLLRSWMKLTITTVRIPPYYILLFISYSILCRWFLWSRHPPSRLALVWNI